MRWDSLFANLGERFEAIEDAESEAELPDRIRVEYGESTLQQRLAGAVGAPVRLWLSSGDQLAGDLARTGPDWVLVHPGGPDEVLVPLKAIAGIEGITARTGPALTGIDSRLDFRRAIRALARDRASIRVSDVAGVQVTGTVDRVGSDHFEMAVHPLGELRRAPLVRSIRLIPLAAVATVRSFPNG